MYENWSAKPRLLGMSLERKAARYLRNRGLTLLCSNYSCKLGEIDLIMSHGERQLVFVEVRFRRSDDFGSALESVNAEKRRKLRLTARHFLQASQKFSRMNCRFDVIAVLAPAKGSKLQFQWIKDAFH